MNVICLVTVYFPTEQNVSNVKAISMQCDKIFVCDNTPDTDNSKLFSSVSDVSEKGVYIANGKNMGISAAFNFVLKNSKYDFDDEDFIIFFDQDSVAKENHVKSLVAIYETIEKSVNVSVGAMGPSFFDKTIKKNRVAKMKKRTAVPNVFEVPQIITSSMVAKYKNLKKVGFWNEEVFLDFADWDLCFRMKNIGLNIFVTTDLTMEHSLGKGIKKIAFLKKHFDSPIREYYQTREASKLYKKDYVPLKFKMKFLFVYFLRPFFDCVFLPEKTRRMMFIAQAKKEHGKNGEYKGPKT